MQLRQKTEYRDIHPRPPYRLLGVKGRMGSEVDGPEPRIRPLEALEDGRILVEAHRRRDEEDRIELADPLLSRLCQRPEHCRIRVNRRRNCP